MIQIDFTPFLDHGGHHEWFNRPFAHDGSVYATNGHILIKVDGKQKPDAEEFKTHFPRQLDMVLGKFKNFPAGDFSTLPDLPELVFDTCKVCEGAGFAEVVDCVA